MKQLLSPQRFCGLYNSFGRRCYFNKFHISPFLIFCAYTILSVKMPMLLKLWSMETTDLIAGRFLGRDTQINVL